MRSASGRGVSVAQAGSRRPPAAQFATKHLVQLQLLQELLLLAAARTMSWPMCVSCPILQPPGRRGMSCRAGKAGDDRSDEAGGRRPTDLVQL